MKYAERQGGRGRERSLPSRERGLKFMGTGQEAPQREVAPLAGAWIEIPMPTTT